MEGSDPTGASAAELTAPDFVKPYRPASAQKVTGHVLVTGKIINAFENSAGIEVCAGDRALNQCAVVGVGNTNTYPVGVAPCASGEGGMCAVFADDIPLHADPRPGWAHNAGYRGKGWVRFWNASAMDGTRYEVPVQLANGTRATGIDIDIQALDQPGSAAECMTQPRSPLCNNPGYCTQHSDCGVGGYCSDHWCAYNKGEFYLPTSTRPDKLESAGCEYFSSDPTLDTKQYVCGYTLDYWRKNGGLLVFGLPFTDSRQEAPDNHRFQVQWFQRNRIELHPFEPQLAYTVMLGRLGSQIRGDNWAAGDGQGPMPAQATRCRVLGPAGYPGYWVCDDVLRYWETHGVELGAPGVSSTESLALHGYPISTLSDWQTCGSELCRVQWFERAKLEYYSTHPVEWKVQGGLIACQAARTAGVLVGYTPGCP